MVLTTIAAHSLDNTTFFLHALMINLHSPFFFILAHLWPYFVIHLYPSKTVDLKQSKDHIFIQIFSQRSFVNFLLCLTLATVLQYFYSCRHRKKTTIWFGRMRNLASFAVVLSWKQGREAEISITSGSGILFFFMGLRCGIRKEKSEIRHLINWTVPNLN